MATIKYGKGQNLQPTSVKILRAVLHGNAQTGRVEMPDVRQVRTDSDRPGADGLVRIKADSTDVRHVKDTMAVRPDAVAARLKGKRVAVKAGKASASAGEKEEVRVTIDAPDVLHFFSTRKTKAFSY